MKNTLLLFLFAATFCLKTNAQQARAFFGPEDGDHSFNDLIYHFGLNPNSKSPKIKSLPELRDSLGRYLAVLERDKKALEYNEFYGKYGYNRHSTIQNYWQELNDFCKKFLPKGKFLQDAFLNSRPKKYDYYATNAYESNTMWLYILGILNKNELYIDWAITYIERSADGASLDAAAFYLEWVDASNRDIAKRAYGHYYLLQNLNTDRDYKKAAYYNQLLRFLFDNKKTLQKQSPTRLYKIVNQDTSNLYQSILYALSSKFEDYVSDVDSSYRQGNYMVSLDSFLSMDFKSQRPNAFNSAALLLQEQYRNPAYKGFQESLDLERIHFFYKYSVENSKPQKLEWLLRQHILYFKMQVGDLPDFYAMEVAFLRYWDKYREVANMDSLMLKLFEKAWVETPDSVLVKIYNSLQPYLYHETDRLVLQQSIAATEGLTNLAFRLRYASWFESQRDSVDKTNRIYIHLLNQQSVVNETFPRYLSQLIQQDNYYDPETFQLVLNGGYLTLYHLFVEKYLKFYTANNDAKVGRDSSLLLPFKVGYQSIYALVDSIPEHLIVAGFQNILNYQLKQYPQDTANFLKWELKRLEKMHELSWLENRDELYVNALQSLYEQYKGTTQGLDIGLLLVEKLTDFGQSYEDAPYEYPHKRWLWKNASDFAFQLGKVYKKDYRVDDIIYKIRNLNKQRLGLTAASFVLANQPFKVLAKNRSIDTIFVKIYPQHFQALSEYHEAIYATDSIPFLTFNIPNLNHGDLREHITELPIPALPAGQYNLEFGYKDYEKDLHLEAVSVTVSNIMLVPHHKNSEDSISYHLVHRHTGQPLANARVSVYAYQRDTIYFETDSAAYSPFTFKDTVMVYEKIGHVFEWEFYNFSDAFGKITFPVKRCCERYDDNGNFLNNSSHYKKIAIRYQDDSLYVDNSVRTNDYIHSTEPTVYHGHLFTDRAIYRPGQTVYFKGLITDGEGQTVQNPNWDGGDAFSATVELRDSRGEYVMDRYVLINQFGSFSDSMMLPTTGMTGEYTLKIQYVHIDEGNGSHVFMEDSMGRAHANYAPTTFNVEEYKRPTFETTFLPLDKYYSVTDLVPVKGTCKAYAGYPIANARISYKVEYEVNFPDRWWFDWEDGYDDGYGGFTPKYQKKKVVCYGNTTSNDLGEFTIPFRGERHSKHNEYAEYFYTITADITDALTGETHPAKYDVRLCEQALNVRLDVPEELFANQDYNLGLTIEDAAQKAVNTQANLRIYKLKIPAAPKHLPIWEQPTSFVLSEQEHDVLFPNLPYKNEYEINNWEKGEAVFSFAFNPTEQADYLLKKNSLAEGDYVAELEVFDSIQNRPILVKRYFKYFDLNKKDCQVSTPIWMYVDKTTVNIGDTLNFHFASAKKEAYVLVRIEQNGILLYKKWIKINGKITESIVVPNRFKGDVHYYIDVAMDNRNYTNDGHINVLYSPIKVQIEFLSFRDKLLPGQKERWEWTIKDQFGKPLKAEMLATLYDASLDVMRRNRFVINSPFKKYTEYQLAFDWESLFDLVYSGGAYTYSYDTIVTFDPETFEEPVSVVANSSEPEKVKVIKLKPKPNSSPKAQKQNAIRTNLKETVFFKPHLQTDKDGKIVLEFTMNEALTRWRLMLLAHTNQMEYAMSERTIVTQKEIMVQPNVPRFVRVGDELVFTAKVVNLTKEAKKGVATLEILDPATMKAVKVFLPKVHAKQKFDLEAQKSGQVSWKIKIPAGYEHLVYRVIATSGKMSDGEQNKFAILPNTMLATQNTPINLMGKQSQNYDLRTLLPITSSQQSEAYGLELTTNPAWDAIRGLSYMMEYPYHCSEQLLNRYYANSLAAAVFQSNPKVSKTFKKWRTQGLEKSKLLENNELREALLAESPWLASATGEDEIRQRLGLLFDLDSMRSRQGIVLDMLLERQNKNGGFSWYGGGESSLYISQYVLENLGHLKQLTGNQFPVEKTAAILSSASRYVDKVVQKNYTDWMRYIKEVGADTNRFALNELNVHYLYARSFMPMDSSTAVSFNFVLEQAWRKRDNFISNDYLTGLLCLALHRNGKKTEAMQLVDSLRSHATTENNMMYWQKTSGYYWYQNCLETQALMVEVFHEVAKDPKAVQAMKTWLIQQKSDNYWNSTKATSAAVYALLIGGNWLSNSKVPTITVNNKTVGITEENLEPGTGYFKQRWEKQDITDVSLRVQQIAITNNNKEVPIYGSIYHQYYTPLDQIKVVTDTNACHLRKLIYKVIYTEKGDSLALVTDKTILNTGDKLRIKLQFYAPQPLEFLHLKDQRPASCEPTEQLSVYRYQNGIGYYQSLRDASSNFFIEYLPKGKHELVYDMLVNQKGRFQSGYSMLQSMYVPEYTVYDRSVEVRVE